MGNTPGNFAEDNISSWKQEQKRCKKTGFESLIQKKESTGPCFIKGNNYRPFLKQMMKKKNVSISTGFFKTCDDKILGEHEGYPFYTVGQRRGLGIKTNRSYYVSEIIPGTNTVVLGNKKSLLKNSFFVKDYILINLNDCTPNKKITVRIRYRKQETPCHIEIINNLKLKVILHEPLDSIAPGQAAVFYKDDIVLGGGFIE